MTDGLICKLCSVSGYMILADPAQNVMFVCICLLLHVLTDGLICRICSFCGYIILDDPVQNVMSVRICLAVARFD